MENKCDCQNCKTMPINRWCHFCGWCKECPIPQEEIEKMSGDELRKLTEKLEWISE